MKKSEKTSCVQKNSYLEYYTLASENGKYLGSIVQ